MSHVSSQPLLVIFNAKSTRWILQWRRIYAPTSATGFHNAFDLSSLEFLIWVALICHMLSSVNPKMTELVHRSDLFLPGRRHIRSRTAK